jgi:hypothetical protein
LFACGAVHAAAVVDEFLYHTEPRDTLIGIGRRLLLEPQRWRGLQSRNHIVDPRRIPRGQILRIPYEWLKLRGETATVANLAGQVEQGGKKLEPGEVLPQGSVIETGVDGSVTLNLADGSVVTLQKSSVLTLDEMVQITGVAAARSIRLKLDSGRLETVVKPHRDVGRFEIITPVAVSAVRGTQFRDSFTGTDSHATTETLEGTVGVANDADSVAVAAGFGTRIERNQAPLKPVELLPAPNLADVPDTNTTAALRVRWPAVAGAQRYRLQLAADPQFHALRADVLAADSSASVADLPDGDYWLRARSIDPLGIEGADAVRAIKQHRLPDAPQPTAPVADARITGNTIHVAWTGSAAATTYALQVADTATFAAPVLERQHLATPSADIDALPAGRYFWRVAAINAHGEAGPWSDVRSYTQRAEMPMPEAPRLETRRVLFRWQPVPGQSYRLQIAPDAQFDHAILDQRLDGTEWSMSKPFPGVYFCRVQSIDADGSGGPFSAARRFVVPIPLWVKVATPLAIGLAFLL